MASPREHSFRSAWWVPGGHCQTLWGKLVRPNRALGARSECWRTPDGDRIEIHRLDAAPDRPRLFLLHGLEGTARSHYLGPLLDQARLRGWGADLLMFRSCGAVENTARRFYHSGETTDLAFALARVMQEFPKADIVMCGVSLGGNVLLKWLGECAASVPARVRAAATISVPFDLERGSRHIARGFSHLYERHFVRTLKRKAMAKLARYPDLFDPNALRRVRTLWDFDEVVTAPVHGFASARDYYTRSSSLGYLERIRVPTLLLNAADDPFLPAAVLDVVRRIARSNSCLTVEFPPGGGHVGFVGGVLPWRPAYFGEWLAGDFLSRHVA